MIIAKISQQLYQIDEVSIELITGPNQVLYLIEKVDLDWLIDRPSFQFADDQIRDILAIPYIPVIHSINYFNKQKHVNTRKCCWI